jgi:type II secretory pathway component PulF
MQFAFKALNGQNEIVKSVIEAANEREALLLLSSKNLRPFYIRHDAEKKRMSITEMLTANIGKAPTMTRALLLTFFEKLHKMLSAGMPIANSIESINKRTANAAEKIFSGKLLNNLSSGNSFFECMERLTPLVDSNMLSIIQVGESSGSLAPALEDIIKFLRARKKLKEDVRKATTYPLFMASFAAIALLLFLFVLVPFIEKIIGDLGGTMPAMVARLKSVAAMAAKLVIPAMIAVLAAVAAVLRMCKNARGRYICDEFMLKIPILSGLLILFSRTSLTNLMAILLSNGVNITLALDLAQNSLKNLVLRGRFASAKSDIIDGKGVYESFEKNMVLDGVVCDLIAVGEKVGDLASAFRDANKLYDAELDGALRKLITKVTAVAMGVVLAIVGLFATCVVQTLMGVVSGLGQ